MKKERTENCFSKQSVNDSNVYCERCGRRLSNPTSIARKYGPVCYGKILHTGFIEDNYMLPLTGEAVGHNKMLNGENIIDIKEKIN